MRSPASALTKLADAFSSGLVRVHGGTGQSPAGQRAYLGYGLTAAFGWAGEGEDDARSRTWDAGVFGELGGTYFLTSHFSLGAQGGLYATYADSHYRASQPPIATRDRSLNVQVRPVRIVGGLYF